MFIVDNIWFQAGLVISFAVFFLFFILPVIFIGAPFMPSYRAKANWALHLPAIINFLKNDSYLISSGAKKMVDLGSGDGRIVIEFAKAGFESYGVELNPFLVWWSKLKIRKLGLKTARVEWGNFWRTNLEDFDAVFMFHFKTANRFLAKKFKRELKDNTIIISTGFPLVGLELVKKEGPFLVYRV